MKTITRNMFFPGDRVFHSRSGYGEFLRYNIYTRKMSHVRFDNDKAFDWGVSTECLKFSDQINHVS